VGERVDGIEHDPLETREQDYSVEYNSVPGFLRRQISTTGDEKYHLQPHDKSVALVHQMLERSRLKKQKKDQGEGEGISPIAEQEDEESKSPVKASHSKADDDNNLVQSEIIDDQKEDESNVQPSIAPAKDHQVEAHPPTQQQQ
jgi:hypothetical protein